MPSAFISYAHEDHEFVLALVGALQAEGLNIRYDRIALRVGDSLIDTIAREIHDGDFLIAVISPDSAQSTWCQRELALAETQGINQGRVKVLPVRFRQAAMPLLLGHAVWCDADRYDVATVARELAQSMLAHLAGAAAAPPRPGQGVEREAALAPARAADRAAEIAALDTVVEKLFDLISQWDRCRDGDLTRNLTDKQRRLSWALEALCQPLRDALPLVQLLSAVSWSDYFQRVESATAEPDIREELRAARSQLVNGLPLARRWMIDRYMRVAHPGGRDATVYLWQIRRSDETKRIEVFISGTVMAIPNEQLPEPVARAKETSGRSAVVGVLAMADPPRQMSVSTAGIADALPD